jgi:hypothetical protein
MADNPVLIALPGYAEGLRGAIPTVAESGGVEDQTSYKIPPVVWMFIFLVAGYVGLRMVLED